MKLDPADPLSRIIPLRDAAALAGVSARTVRRWVASGQLELLPHLPGRFVTARAVLECERDRHVAGHQGRPGARVGLTP